jgi:hypothetical protein
MRPILSIVAALMVIASPALADLPPVALPRPTGLVRTPAAQTLCTTTTTLTECIDLSHLPGRSR